MLRVCRELINYFAINMYPLLCFKPRVSEYELMISKKHVHSSSFISSEYFLFSIGVLMCWFRGPYPTRIGDRDHNIRAILRYGTIDYIGTVGNIQKLFFLSMNRKERTQKELLFVERISKCIHENSRLHITPTKGRMWQGIFSSPTYVQRDINEYFSGLETYSRLFTHVSNLQRDCLALKAYSWCNQILVTRKTTWTSFEQERDTVLGVGCQGIP